MIQTFWSGMRQEIRIRLIEWGISPEHTPLEVMVSKAINIENSEEAYRRELCNEKQAGTPEQSWGRFANRIDGPNNGDPLRKGEDPNPRRGMRKLGQTLYLHSSGSMTNKPNPRKGKVGDVAGE